MDYTKIYYKDASEVLSMLLDAGHLASAGRLAGAFRNIGPYGTRHYYNSLKTSGYSIARNRFRKEKQKRPLIGAFNTIYLFKPID